jgi:hypothetical protein
VRFVIDCGEKEAISYMKKAGEYTVSLSHFDLPIVIVSPENKYNACHRCKALGHFARKCPQLKAGSRRAPAASATKAAPPSRTPKAAHPVAPGVNPWSIAAGKRSIVVPSAPQQKQPTAQMEVVAASSTPISSGAQQQSTAPPVAEAAKPHASASSNAPTFTPDGDTVASAQQQQAEAQNNSMDTSPSAGITLVSSTTTVSCHESE